MRLGLFDANGTSANRDIPIETIGAAEHKQASLDAARQAFPSCLPCICIYVFVQSIVEAYTIWNGF